MLHTPRPPTAHPFPPPCRELPGLGLEGVLPPDLFRLRNVAVLNLSNNVFTGTLPPQWTSTTLATLDLSNNRLSGPLPEAYGSKETFPKLAAIYLQGNQFSGPLPGPEWMSTGFAPQAVITLRPGNNALCGPVPIVNPDFYTTMPSGDLRLQLAGPTLVSSTGVTLNTSQAYIVARNMLAGTSSDPPGAVPPPTNIVVTNTLGSCVDPCGRTAPLVTNILDATWDNNVTLADLLVYNPGLSTQNAKPGTQLALPCYPSWLEPTTFGSDAAHAQFAGGNQRSVVGTVGAELAGGVVGSNGLNNSAIYYEGIADWEWGVGDGGSGGIGMEAFLVEPVYWFVTLGAPFTVSAVSIKAGKAMSNIAVYVGTNQDNVRANAEVASGLEFAPGETRVVPAAYVRGDMVSLYAGYADEGTMSLAQVNVWPSEGNAALRKPAFASSSPPDLNTTVDGSTGSCAFVRSGAGDGLWFGVDLGYEADVSVVMLTMEGSLQGTSARVFVSSAQEMDAVSNATVCATLPPAPWGQRVGVSCERVGRYVGVQVEGQNALRVCEIEVFLSGGCCRC